MATEKQIDKKVDKKVAKKKERRFHPLRYLKEMMGEVKKLSWLSKKDLAKHTFVVFIFVIVMGVAIWLLDLGFGKGVGALLTLAPEAPVAAEPAE